MFEWIARLLGRRPPAHEPEVEAQRRDQRAKFADWESTMAEVQRVQRLAARQHSDMHKPRHR